MRRTASAVVLGALLALAAALPARADPVPIRVGWAQAPGHLAPLIRELQRRHPEVFRHFGESYVAEPIRFQGSTPQIVAMAVGELEVAAFGSSAFALAVTNAHLDVRVVADVIQDGVGGHFSQPYMVRKDGPIQTIEDVRGHRIATNAIGSASDAAMRIVLHRHGVLDADITSAETNFANMPAMIEDGKVDLIALLPQFAPRIEASGRYRALFHINDAFGTMQTVHWAMRADFIAAHRAAVVDFFEDHIRALRWFLDPANRADALAIAADVTRLPADNLAYCFTQADWYRSPDARPEIKAIQIEIDESAKLGILPSVIRLEPAYVDLSLIEDAKRRIDGN
ncbi:MAG TPA: ABC transporter substrate-binding protein [Stellaceae bacterium]|nr:ABC transporter substrate-binding protein [Stellaceae bacterium]